MDEQIKTLKQYIDESSHIVAITGAGISFSAGGLNFEREDPEAMQSMLILGSEDGLKNHPEEYYAALEKGFLHSMFEIGPSPAHYALARLEEEGKLDGIITTNVDCMHTMAGSKNVLEIQGSLQLNRCADCWEEYNDYNIWRNGKVPECTKCGGKIWSFPFYTGIGLDQPVVREARRVINDADLILIIGTNGPYSNYYWRYRNHKAKIVQINPESTPFDRAADLNIRKSADEVFTELDLVNQ